MFKLIYSLSGKEITLKYRKKEVFWNKELLIAFSIALTLHAFAYFSLNIRRPAYSSPIFLNPVSVRSEIKSDQVIRPSFLINEFGIIEMQIGQPAGSVKPIAEMVYSPFPEFSSVEKALLDFDQQFHQVEDLETPLYPSKLVFQKEIKPLSINIYGELNQRFQGLNVEAKKVLFGTTEVLKSKFTIQVEDRTGEVFDVTLLQSCGYAEYDHYATNIVKSLHFDQQKEGAISQSELEIILELNKDMINDYN